jgi:hypothetical protein
VRVAALGGRDPPSADREDRDTWLEERSLLLELLVASGTRRRLNHDLRPSSHLALSDPCVASMPGRWGATSYVVLFSMVPLGSQSGTSGCDTSGPDMPDGTLGALLSIEVDGWRAEFDALAKRLVD